MLGLTHLANNIRIPIKLNPSRKSKTGDKKKIQFSELMSRLRKL